MTSEKCPVCNGDAKQGKNVNVEGKNFRVCSDDCATQLKKDPSKYIGAGVGSGAPAFSGGGAGSGSGGYSPGGGGSSGSRHPTKSTT